MRKLIQSTVMGLMMLAATLALQAGQVKLAWTYNFEAEPAVTSFRLYALQGSNSVFALDNANAFTAVTVTKAQASLTATLTNGITTNLTGTVSNLHSGWWTFVVTALDTNNVESVNSASVSSSIKPPPVWNVVVVP